MTILNEENSFLSPPIRRNSLSKMKKNQQVRIVSPKSSRRNDQEEDELLLHTKTHADEDSICVIALSEEDCLAESSSDLLNDNSVETFESVSWFLPLPDLVSPRRDKTPTQPAGRKKSTREEPYNNNNSQPARQPRRVKSIDPKPNVDSSPQVVPPLVGVPQEEIRRWNSLVDGESDDVAPCCYERSALDLDPVTTKKSCQIGKAA